MSLLGLQEETSRDGSPMTADLIRDQLVSLSKDFKTAWIDLGRALYPVFKDKLFYSWGFEKFEYYVHRELGIKKQTATKLLKTYYFIEQEEPGYLDKDFSDSRQAHVVPDCDAINVLRLARNKKELGREDYKTLRKSVFEKGKDATVVRKDLTAIMKQRKEVDPDEERQERSNVSVRKLVNAMRSFEKDMNSLKLLPDELVKETKELMKKLSEQVES